jgi:hypothetical protein
MRSIPRTRFAHKVREGPKLSPGGTGVTNRGSIRPDIAKPPLVRAGSCWFGLVEGIFKEGLGVSRSVEKENGLSVFLFSDGLVVALVALLRFWIRAAVLRLTYVAPRLALQLAHDPTMLVLS